MLQGLESAGMTLNNKMRLIAIFIISQEGVTEEVRRQLVAAAGKVNKLSYLPRLRIGMHEL